MTRAAGIKFVNIFSRLFLFLAPEWPLVVVLLMANIMLICFQVYEPVLFGELIDVLGRIGNGRDSSANEKIISLFAIWGMMSLAGAVFNMFVATHSDRMAHRQKHAAIIKYFEHVLNMPASFFEKRHSGRILQVMYAGSEQMFSIWLNFFREHFATMLSLVCLVPVAISLNWRLGMLLIVLFIVLCAITSWVVRKTHRHQILVRTFYADVGEYASDSISNVSIVQSFTRIPLEVRRLKRALDALLAAQMPGLKLWALSSILSQLASHSAIILIFLLGAVLLAHRLATIGEIVTFMGFASMFIGRLQHSMGFFTSICDNAHVLAEFYEVIDTKSDVVDSAHAQALSSVKGHVQFENVTVSYLADTPVLDQLSFEIPSGTIVAIVGRTGAGKSTAMAMLSRVRDPDLGRILLDGTDIRSVTLDSLRRQIGVVFQDNQVFCRSIEENLSIGKVDATTDELDHVVRLAQMHDFVAAKDGGLKGLIGEHGAKLSGGERQRLGIARALLKDPPILILDEATSALDAMTERQIQQVIALRRQKKTTFIIAHRLSTIRHADLILVFERGRIIERGSYDSLLSENGRFAEMVRMQTF